MTITKKYLSLNDIVAKSQSQGGIMKHKLLHIGIAIISALVLLVLDYISQNDPYPYGEQTTKLTFIETSLQKLFPNRFSSDEVLFLNTSYNLTLIETWRGKEIYTDRAFLTKLLSGIDSKSEYRAVFLDIRLQDKLDKEVDSLLIAQIKKMRKPIVIAKHWDYENKMDFSLIDSTLVPYAAYCDYTASLLKTGFSRYQYIQHDSISAPLAFYQKLNGGNIQSHDIWFWKNAYYTDSHRLCLNSLFISIPEDFSDRHYSGKEGEGNNYWNVHEEFLGPDAAFEPEDLWKLCENRIIIIGDYVNDRHGTYLGMQPGPYINYLSYHRLKEGDHILKPWFILLIGLVYAWIFFVIFEGKNFFSRIPFVRKSKNTFLRFLFNLGGYATLLSIINIFSYIFFHRPVGIFVPSIVFSICALIFKYKKYASQTIHS